MNSFFVLPGHALADLREELEIIEEEGAGGTLERFGFRAGVGLAKSLDIECESYNQLSQVLPQLWAETGLSNIEITKIEEGEILLNLYDSLEASRGRRCDFSRGYLAGIVSSLTGRAHQAEEISCRSAGARECRHRITPREEFGEIGPLAAIDTEIKWDLEKGYSYLIERESPEPAFEVFSDYVMHGARGLSISREYPEKLRKKFQLENTSFLWLSYERDMDFAREPTNIPLIYSEIKSFLDSSDERVVIISGLEYLISQSTFRKVLKFVQLLNETVAVRESLLLLPISPKTLDSKEVKLLERELRILELD